MRRTSSLDRPYLILVASGSVYAAARCIVASSGDLMSLELWCILAAIALSAGAAVTEVRASGASKYFPSLALQTAGTATAMALAGGDLSIDLTLLAVLTVGACLHNPYPLNAVVSVAAGGVAFAVGAASRSGGASTPAGLGDYAMPRLLLMASISLFASFMVRFRERLGSAQEELGRMDALIDRLARANLRYQEYARSVEEVSVDSERRRITRDIHDIVGYTLTNNITLMEAITDTMQTNPLGVEHLVESARQNAQEGLARAREALYELRRQDIAIPRGRPAVQHLVKVFEHATGVRAELAYTEVPWDFPDELDSAFYHVIQESLMNSFRHGRASVIRVFLQREEGSLVLRVTDDGQGADTIAEGIGLSGMRERLEKLGGTLRAGNAPGGFSVTATVPAGAP